MTEICVDRLDHVHVEVSDRAASADRFDRILGLVQVKAMATWADDPSGPLFLQSRSGRSCLALFERKRAGPASGDHTIAFHIDWPGFIAFIRHLTEIDITESKGRLTPADVVDHDLSWSLYSSIPTAIASS